jgi:hypothetical protein
MEQEKIKGAKSIIYIGFLSFVGCVFYALPGTVIAIWGFRRFIKVRKVALTNQSKFEISWVDARVGLILCVLGLLTSIVTIVWSLSLFWPIWFGRPMF